MAIRKAADRTNEIVMGVDPLTDDDEILARTLYGPGDATEAPQVAPVSAPAAPRPVPAPQRQAPLPAAKRPAQTPAAAPIAKRRTASPQDANHYKVLSISLYNDDIEKMDELVRELKKRGFTRANRSALIRFALDQVDISKMPKGY